MSERTGGGQFLVLPIGATPLEQQQAGVTSYDNEHEATIKVQDRRLREGIANGTMVYKPSRYGGVVILNIALIVICIFIFGNYWDGHQYTAVTEVTVDMKSRVGTDSYKQDAQLLAPLFVPGTDIDAIYKGCKVRNCVMPDIYAFDAYKRFSAHPENYDQDLCKMYYLAHLAPPSSKVQPNWVLNRKRSQCVATNAKELRIDAYRQNESLWMWMKIFAIAGVLALIIANFFLVKTTD